MIDNKLIFGKQELSRVVSVEPGDETTEVFRELEDGSIVSSFEKNRYWLLSDRCIDERFMRLKGDLHYKWGRLFKERQSFLKARSYYKRDNDTYSIFNPKESFLVKTGHTYFKGMKLQDVSVLSFDIETSGLVYDETSMVFLISNTFRKQGKLTKKLFCVWDYQNEAEMLKAWVAFVRDLNPSLLVGHNIESYDFPYLNHVANLNGIDLNIGRDGSALEFDGYESKFRKDQTQFIEYRRAKCYGREIVDTLFLSIKYDIASKKYETYGLKNIIKQEGLERAGRVYYDASQIRNNINIPEERKKIETYCVDDSDEALALFDLMAPSFFYLTQSVPKPFQLMVESATGSQVNSLMVRSYLQIGHSIPKADGVIEFEGAISRGTPGIYRNSAKVDIASLYPSIMLQYEVGNVTKDPNHHFFQLVNYFTTERIKNKKLAKETGDTYYKDLEQSQKIFINSAYGFLGTNGLNFNDGASAAFVTRKGREILQRAIKWAEDKGMMVPGCDTDSILYCKSDQSEIGVEERKALLADLNTLFPERIRFEDDGYFPSVLYFKAKNYCLNDGQKVKYKGSALKSSTLEPALKDFLHEMVESLLNGKAEELAIYKKYVREVLNIQNIKKWCTKKTLTSRVYESERANETKILDAVAGREFSPGDKVYLFYKPDRSLALVDTFQAGCYDVNTYLEKLYKAVQRFEDVLDLTEFLNYKLKRNKKALEEL